MYASCLRFAHLKLTIVTGLWIGATLAGLIVLIRHEQAAGESGMAPTRWPQASRIAISPDRATLVMFAHTHCPCTRASLGELERVLANCQGLVDARIVLLKPANRDEDPLDTPIGRAASQIAGVTIVCDDGSEAGWFQAATSGHTVLYDTQGKLVFQGGITGSRGHAGDNPGRSAVEALLHDKNPLQNRSAVFGCGLAR